MSEKRFILCQDDLGHYEIRYDDKVFHFLWEVAPILNEQQATINELEETNKAMYNRLKEQSEIIYQLIQKLKEHITEKELKELMEDCGL